MILGYVMGYHEIINGTKYFVGEDGSFADPPTDHQFRSQLVGHRIFEHNLLLLQFMRC